MKTPTVLVTTASTSGISRNVVGPQNGFDVSFHQFDKTNIPSRKNAMHPRLAGKIYKMLAWELYPGFDYYIWIDSNFALSREDAVSYLVDKTSGSDAAFFMHPNRKTVREELDFCINGMKAGDQYLIERYEGEDMEKQVSQYLLDPWFNDDLLLHGAAFIYSKDLVQNRKDNVMKEWFHHNCLYSVQDQLSLPYLLYKYKVNFNVISENAYSSIYLK